MKNRKSSREKLERVQEAKVEETSKGKMLIPKPLDVDALMRRVEKGKLVTASRIRSKLAKDHGADYSCPMTTGIFIRVAAEAAEEDRKAGRENITPYWRVIRDDGSLNEKLPGGTDAQTAYLKKEGHVIIQAQGKKLPKVKDFEKVLQKL